MTESITPYIKITNERHGGFGDLTIASQNIEMNDLQNPPTDTDSLTQNPDTSIPIEWDSLCKPDIESCFISFYVPCHVVGLVGKKIGLGYPSLFIVYGFFICIFNYCYYVFSYAIKPVCNANHYTDWCFLKYDKADCIQSYTKMNSNKVLCMYNHEYHTCYASESTCISKYEFNVTWGAWCFLEIISLSAITIVHVFVRRRLKHKQKISQDTTCKDFMYALYCTTCSFAQQYRALDDEENNSIIV